MAQQGKKKKKRLSNKPEKKQSNIKPIKLTDTIDTSRSVQHKICTCGMIDVETVIKKDKEVKESDVFDLPKKTQKFDKASKK
tara:strand:- start:777 stop:1022 length:246 start_codon:yes stop_codon:yes gene_type:complete